MTSFTAVFLISLLYQGADAVLQFYSGNWVKALIDTFPDLELDEFKFRNISSMISYLYYATPIHSICQAPFGKI
jgi:hypothetical protein